MSARPIAGVGGFGSGRLIAWTILIGAIATINFVGRYADGSKHKGRPDLYTWNGAGGGVVFYAVFFALVYAIAAVDVDELFALRRPRSWGTAASLGILVFVGIEIWSAIVSTFPLPKSLGKEQGITPSHWEPHYAKQYAANFVVLALVGPFVEELAFRGVGYRLLLERFGRWLAIVLVGVAFGLSHGVLEGLLILVPFGVGLAYVRDRTNSTIPGMILHGVFNTIALVAVVVS